MTDRHTGIEREIERRGRQKEKHQDERQTGIQTERDRVKWIE